MTGDTPHSHSHNHSRVDTQAAFLMRVSFVFRVCCRDIKYCIPPEVCSVPLHCS